MDEKSGVAYDSAVSIILEVNRLFKIKVPYKRRNSKTADSFKLIAYFCIAVGIFTGIYTLATLDLKQAQSTVRNKNSK